MVRYKLSKHISVTSFEENYEVAEDSALNKHYILYDARRDKEYIINPTVKYFIDKLSVPKALDELFNEVAGEIEGDKVKIDETCYKFFSYLFTKQIVVEENADEEIILNEPFYKEGDLVGDLVITELLSSKRYVDIYTANNQKDNSSFVIKLLNRNKIPDQKVFDRELWELEREYHLLKDLESVEEMCKAYSFNKEHEGNAYIVVEHIEGKSLFAFLEETEDLTQQDSIDITENILRAFSALHNSKIIHGDIHSSNILIAKDKRTKIIDLGFSRNVETENNELIPTGGVHFYMPPERINTTSTKKFTKQPDLYSDVYQIGILMYLVLYNHLPFDGFIWEELAQHIKEGNVTFAETSFNNFPVPVEQIEIIKRCLNKNPEERYTNASAIFQDFKKSILTVKEFV